MKHLTGIRLMLLSLYIAVVSTLIFIWGPTIVVVVYSGVLGMAWYVLYLAVLPSIDGNKEMPNTKRFWIIQLLVLVFLSILAITRSQS